MTLRPLLLGKDERGRDVLFSQAERETHTHIIGVSRRGKSKLLENIVRQDINEGRGVCVLDPHGTLYKDIVRWCASVDHVMHGRTIHLLDAGNVGSVPGFNALRVRPGEDVTTRVRTMASAIGQITNTDLSNTPQLKEVLHSILHTLAVNNLTLVEAKYLLSALDTLQVREYLTANIEHPVQRFQWQRYDDMNPSQYLENVASTCRRLVDLVYSNAVRRILGQADGFDFRTAMDNGDVVLVNLATTNQFQYNDAKLIGRLIINTLYTEALGRGEGGRPFHLIIDECHRFLTDDIVNSLDETAKFGLHLTLAHQRLGQLRDADERGNIYNGVMSSAQNKIAFGTLEPEDARLLAERLYFGEFDRDEVKTAFNKPTVVGYDLVRLAGGSHADGYGHSESESSSSSATMSETFDGTITGNDERQVWGESAGDTAAQSASISFTHTNTSGWSETYRPVLEDRPTLPYSLDEQVYLKARELFLLAKRQAILSIPGKPSRLFLSRFVQEPLTTDEFVASYEAKQHDRASFTAGPQAIDELIEERGRALIKSAGTAEDFFAAVDFKEPVPEE